MIEFAEARALVLAAARRLPAETVPLAETLGRTLARDVKAREAVPPFTKSAMDGYAVRSADTRPGEAGAGLPPAAVLEVIEDLPAGRTSRKEVGPGQAVRIMTGAPLPRGADAVVMVEDTEAAGRMVRVRRAVKAGDNIGLAGEDLEKGETALVGGALLGPAEIGLLAAAGWARVPVARRPRLAVIATGDEIVEPGERLGRGRIRNANGPALTAMARQAGADAAYLGIARDKNASLAARLARTRGADVVVLSGGVSVGDYDLVKAELEASGVKPVFWKVRIKPGKPVFFGVRGRQMVFGLPGNPTSSLVTFWLFVRPAIDRLLGRAAVGPEAGTAVLDTAIAVKPGRMQFLRGRIVGRGPVLKVVPYEDQRSGVLRSMVHSRVLIVLPADASRLEAGREVEILYTDGR
ncbi:MAG TPA: molybdopterin molybdotransferase MoeA [Candidatus Aminicenantes bacterium]|nr:molybdopterin molybdotransferase MoeA [Candidatus Aminicenantes bacterium]HRY64612.1 molybdopterin molybdotransferase MoeA [Candidatus Aminicenantes bacterium]HRZ71525.1 molybdopterin molybdotransferase MoeA [Candidatus Aminicenantes bacterium]